MNLHIICIGSIKESFYKEAVAEYVKRLSGYCKCEIIELKDEKTPNNNQDNSILKVKEIEGDRILSKLKDDSFLIALDILGEKLSSEKLAKKMQEFEIKSKSNLFFVIGGSLGLSQKVLKRAYIRLSFSDMTFPHQLMRIILLEQIYRSYKIRNNEPYHK